MNQRSSKKSHMIKISRLSLRDPHITKVMTKRHKIIFKKSHSSYKNSRKHFKNSNLKNDHGDKDKD